LASRQASSSLARRERIEIDVALHAMAQLIDRSDDLCSLGEVHL
jgi:hypothetical protein